MRLKVHIAGLGYDWEVITAPLRSYDCDRLYLLAHLPLQLDMYRHESHFNMDMLKQINSNIEIRHVKCDLELNSIFECLKGIANSEQSNDLLINVSSGSRLFTAAAVLLSNQYKIEMYYVERKGYFVQRDFSAGIENVVPLPNLQQPTKKVQIDSTLCFILMPFSESLQPIFTDIVKPIVSKFNFRCLRADDFFDNRPIMDDIWQSIEDARFIISDLTGRNPNVFYETGIAHAMGKEVILLTQRLEDVPFDLRHLRCIVYSDSMRGADKLKIDLEKTISNVINRTKLSNNRI